MKKPEVKEAFSTICIDTVDIAASLCEKYVCAQNGVNAIGEIPYGQGWTLLKKEFEEIFRTITQLGYAVCFISHVKEVSFKKQDNSEYTLIRPSVANSYNNIIENMTDLYGYMHPVIVDGETRVKILFRSNDGTISVGSRFKYFPSEIDASYDALVAALNEAINKEAMMTNNQYITNKRDIMAAKTYDYEGLLNEFANITNTLMAKNAEYYQPRIQQIVEKVLGKGHKVSQATIDQVELINLIVEEVKELN